jgi:hypothetical protein
MGNCRFAMFCSRSGLRLPNPEWVEPALRPHPLSRPDVRLVAATVGRFEIDPRGDLGCA